MFASYSASFWCIHFWSQVMGIEYRPKNGRRNKKIKRENGCRAFLSGRAADARTLLLSRRSSSFKSSSRNTLAFISTENLICYVDSKRFETSYVYKINVQRRCRHRRRNLKKRKKRNRETCYEIYKWRVKCVGNKYYYFVCTAKKIHAFLYCFNLYVEETL